MLPDNRNEIPTPVAACYHPHLKDIAAEIPDLATKANILLLLGRDIIQAHKALDQRSGPPNAPFAQQLALGWVIVDDMSWQDSQTRACKCSQDEHLEQWATKLFLPMLKQHPGKGGFQLSKFAQV